MLKRLKLTLHRKNVKRCIIKINRAILRENKKREGGARTIIYNGRKINNTES